MTIFPFQINEVAHLYNKVSRLKPSPATERKKSEPRDVVNISDEARKRQVLEQARSEVRDRRAEGKRGVKAACSPAGMRNDPARDPVHAAFPSALFPF